MERKYVILDFGKVLAKPTTGNWFITPKFLEMVDMSLISISEVENAIKKHGAIKSRPINTVEEEYELFYEFYDLIFKEINYSKYSSELVHSIAYNFAYENDKYTFYEEVRRELEALKEKYTLILLTDNWPSVNRILDNQDLTKYFDKIYVSSCCGVEKKDGVFFDYPIVDFNIKVGEALFIDDSCENLKIAEEKCFDVLLMDREDNILESEYNKINNLFNI